MERQFGTVLVMCVVLEVVLCAPIQEIESVQSLEEIRPVAPVLGGAVHRSRRQVNPNREQVINNIFQIPISTLTAVSSLLQSTRPIAQRPLFQQHTNNEVQTPTPVSAPLVTAVQGAFFGRQTIGARVAKLSPASDGSSFKI